MSIKTIYGIIKADSTITETDFSTSMKGKCDLAETADTAHTYIGIVLNARDKKIDVIPSTSIQTAYSIAPSTIVSSTASSANHIDSDVSVGNIVKSLFNNVIVPMGEVAYVIGNETGLTDKVRIATKTLVLSEFDSATFIVMFDGVSYSVSKNKSVSDIIVSSILDDYETKYLSVDLSTNPLSALVMSKIQLQFVDKPISFTNTGIVSMINTMSNLFKVMNDNHDFIITYDGSFNAYIKGDISLSEIQSKNIIQ